MRTTTRTHLGTAAVSAMLLLGSGGVAAQEADPRAQVEDIQQRYEQAAAAGDWEAIASMYVDEPIYSPFSGGFIEDREGIRGFYEQLGLKALDIRSSRTEALGENLILDIGTLTATLAGEEGDMEVEGEYVALAEAGADGLRLRSLTAFPLREAPEQP